MKLGYRCAACFSDEDIIVFDLKDTKTKLKIYCGFCGATYIETSDEAPQLFNKEKVTNETKTGNKIA